MAEQFTGIVDGFDQCQPPFCSEDFDIDVTQFECNGNIVYVSWTIADQYNRDWDASTVVQYSLNGQNFSDLQQFSADSSANNSYSTFFEKPADEGLLYIKILATINLLFIEGYNVDRIPLDLNTCIIAQESSIVVPASFCPQTPFGGGSVYILKSIIPAVTENVATTFYFEKDGYCWFINKELYDTEIPVDSVSGNSVLIESIDQSEIKTSCESCSVLLNCPSTEWTEDPAYPGESGKDLAEIYIEYTTYVVRDEIIVYGPDPNADCSGEEIWSSGCVGTSRGEGPGISIPDGSSEHINSDCVGYRGLSDSRSVKQTCFTMRREQLPISMRVEAQCDEDPAGTWWCAYAAGPDFETCKCEGIDDCSEVVESPVAPNFSCAPFTLETVVDVSAQTSAFYTILVGESGTLFTNKGAPIPPFLVQLDLPDAPPLGTWYQFHIFQSGVLLINPSNNDRIESVQGLGQPGKYLWADFPGEATSLTYNGNGRWLQMSRIGIWGIET